MAQGVSRRPLNTEDRVRAWVSPCEICGGQSGTGIGFSPSSSGLPINIIPPLLSILVYHLGGEQYALWWSQFRDIVSPHRPEQPYTGLWWLCVLSA
jgi:hypothetical protein